MVRCALGGERLNLKLVSKQGMLQSSIDKQQWSSPFKTAAQSINKEVGRKALRMLVVALFPARTLSFEVLQSYVRVVHSHQEQAP